MNPKPELFSTVDFRDLSKMHLPVTLHLKGTVIGNTTERTTTKGVEQISFYLMDRYKRSVPCIAHDVVFPAEVFKEGREVAIFYAMIQEGLRNGPGNVWIYSSSYVVVLGNTFLPGAPIDEVCLRSKA